MLYHDENVIDGHDNINILIRLMNSNYISDDNPVFLVLAIRLHTSSSRLLPNQTPRTVILKFVFCTRLSPYPRFGGFWIRRTSFVIDARSTADSYKMKYNRESFIWTSHVQKCRSTRPTREKRREGRKGRKNSEHSSLYPRTLARTKKKGIQ